MPSPGLLRWRCLGSPRSSFICVTLSSMLLDRPWRLCNILRHVQARLFQSASSSRTAASSFNTGPSGIAAGPSGIAALLMGRWSGRFHQRRHGRCPSGQPAPAAPCPAGASPAGAPGTMAGANPSGQLSTSSSPLSSRNPSRRPQQNGRDANPSEHPSGLGRGVTDAKKKATWRDTSPRIPPAASRP